MLHLDKINLVLEKWLISNRREQNKKILRFLYKKKVRFLLNSSMI